MAVIPLKAFKYQAWWLNIRWQHLEMSMLENENIIFVMIAKNYGSEK